MEKRDATNLTEELYERRIQVVRLRKKGFSCKETAETVDIDPADVSRIWKIYINGGSRLSALKPKKRGRKHGEKKKLTVDQETKLLNLLIDKTPDQLELDFYLWSRDAIHWAIKQEFNVDMPHRTITDYLKRWGFRPQKPTKSANEQKLIAVHESAYADLVARAKKEKAEIHWGYDTSGQSDDCCAESFPPNCKTPIVRLNAIKSNINMILTVTNRGKVQFMLYRKTLTGNVFLKFLSQLIKDGNHKVFLIMWDQVPDSKRVSGLLKRSTYKIELFFLPSYLPELHLDKNSEKKRPRISKLSRNKQSKKRSSPISKLPRNKVVK